MKINKTLELEKSRKIHIGSCTRDEFFEFLISLTWLGDDGDLPFRDTKVKDKKDYVEKLRKGVPDAERNLVSKLIKDHTTLLTDYADSKSNQIWMAGVEKVVEDSWGFCFMEAWCVYNNSPRLVIYFYITPEKKLGWFVPKRGNTINPKTGKAIGWDTGYDFTPTAWMNDFPADFEFVCKEFYGEVDYGMHNIIYEVVHSGILRPDFHAARSEFEAYLVWPQK